MASPVAVYDFTLKWVEGTTHSQLIDDLEGVAKCYAFQHEVSEEAKYHHWQGRISLIKKTRLKNLVDLMRDTRFKGAHWSATSCNAKSELFYVIKKDTRVEGPWTEKDEKPPYIPRQIRECPTLRPFQQTVIDTAKIFDPRTVHYVFDKAGNNGKSVLIGHIRAHRLGRVLPPVNDSKDLLRMVENLPTSTFYVFDMPRAMKKDKLSQFYSAIETIKDGYAYDDRYHFKEKIFDSPCIFIFGNHLPDMTLLSKDRWKIWEISPNFKLVPVVPVG